MQAAIVYLLCALTSTVCTLSLFYKYRSSHSRLLLWSSLGFAGFALNNVLLFVDLVLVSNLIDLSIVRTLPALLGLSVMIWGFVGDSV